MRSAALLRRLAALALAACTAFGLIGWLSFRAALAGKIDRAASIEHAAIRPAAAARLAAALLERRLASVSEPQSRAVAAAFGHADASRALADYRAAGGDSQLAAEAEKALRAATAPDSDIALLRAIHGLRFEADRLARPSFPSLPPAASRGAIWLALSGVCAVMAVLLAYAAGRSHQGP